jgi:predicted extracellular nuclease
MNAHLWSLPSLRRIVRPGIAGLLCSVFLAAAAVVHAQTEVVWNFGAAAPGLATPSSGLPADVSDGELKQGNNNGTTALLTTVSVSNTYAGFSASYNAGAAARIGALNTGASGSAFFEFTLLPSAGKQLTLSAVNFGTRSTTTGPQAFTIVTSVDGFVSPVATGTIANNSAWAFKAPAFTPVTGTAGTAVTVRIYGHGGAGGAQANTANWRIDDLKVMVATASVGPVAPVVTSHGPANGAIGVALDAAVGITFNQPVSLNGNWFTITGSVSGDHAATVTGGPANFTLTPTVAFVGSETVTVTVHGAHVSDLGSGTLTMAGDTTFSFATIAPPPLRRVHQVQGVDAASPVAGQNVVLEGVVTGFVTSASGRDGFYLQEEDADADTDPATSEGIYIYTPGNATAATLSIGDVVSVTGTVTEFNGLTELTTLTALSPLGTGPLPAAAVVALPMTSATAFERYESMRVTFPQQLTVSGNEGLGQYGELVLSSGGRLIQPTNVIDPNDAPASGTTSSGTSNVAAVTAFQAANNLNSLVLDDASTRSYPVPTPHLTSTGVDGTRRAGDTVTGLSGVLSYRFNFFRVDPQAPVDFVASNPRPLTPPPVGDAMLRVASANVLNYFLTLGSAGRGADNATEFARQRAKIVAELTTLNADVVGLMEIERSATNAPLADLVAGLNAVLGAGTYAYIDSFAIAGTDLIQVALIYKPAAVAPVGSPITDTGPGSSVHNRPPLAQTFSAVANGEKFTVVVNHLKSKASGSGVDADQGDGQAASNPTRKLQAARLAAFLSTPEATFGDPDVLIIGDLNAYAEEDPIDILRVAGFANQLERFHPGGTYSYQFNNQAGYLDHALANASLAAQLTGAAEWHVNADEPAYFDYNTENKNSAQQAINVGTPFRASDHDPVVIGLKLQPPAPQGFAGWIGQYSIPGAQAGPAHDFDGDGATNFFEYALGLRPDIAGTTGWPAVSATDDGQLAFRFTRPTGLGDVAYAVEVSADLATWAAWPEAPVVETAGDARETLLALIPLNAGKQFVKLSVTQVP